MKYTRRSFFGALGVLPVVTHKSMAHQYHSTTQLPEGLYSKGFVNGYPFESLLRVGSDNLSVERFEVLVTAQKPGSVESLFVALGMGYERQTSFPGNPWLNGKSLLTGFGDVRGNFLVGINGLQPFQDGAISDKQVSAGQKVKLVALAGSKLVPK